MALDPIYSDAIILASLLAFLAIGLTLTYITTRVPNFAHASFATVGIYVALVGNYIWGVSPYIVTPVAFLASGAVAVGLYLLILKPLIRRRATAAILMIATLAFDLVLIAVINIVADFIVRTYHVSSREFTLRSYDIDIGGLPLIVVLAPVAIASLGIGLHVMMRMTKFGIAMRAATENPNLAGTVGINVKTIYTISWLMGGGFAGMAGVFMALWFQGDPNFGPLILPSVFAASIVGGFMSIYGAIAGGLLVGITEVLGTRILAGEFGPWLIAYRPIVPLIFIAVTLLIAPHGLAGINWSRLLGKIGIRI